MAMTEEQKRKIMMPILGVLILFGLWQAIKLFTGGGSTKQPDSQFAAAPLQPGGQGPVVETKTVVKTQVAQAKAPMISEREKQQLEAAKKTQDEYLKLLNQFQVSEMEKRLIESRVNVEAARSNIAKARLERSKSIAEMQQVTGTAEHMSRAFDNYDLVYVGRNNGRWIAVLRLENRFLPQEMLYQPGAAPAPETRRGAKDIFYDVVMGRHLPDGSEVLSITRSSLLLARQDKRRRLILPVTSPKLLTAKPMQAKEREEEAPVSRLTEGQAVGAGSTGGAAPTS